MTIVDWMDAHLYPTQSDHWDDELFRELILAQLTPESELLDLGAGAGIVPQMDFRGHAKHISGVDLDERVTGDPFLDEGRVGSGEEIPYEGSRFDVVIAGNVLEHLDDPGAVFAEVARVLRPGGVFLVKTPNRRHYVPAVARLTPHSFHGFVNRLRGRATADTFPTRYRANTPRCVERWAKEADLAVRDVRLVEGRPEYLRFHPLTYSVGFAYERAVNRLPLLGGLRVLMIGAFEKQPAHQLNSA